MSKKAPPVNRTTAIGIIAALILGTTWFWMLKPGGDVRGVWFYDLESATLYPASEDVRPPAVAPSGGEGVRAQVYTCTTCSESERFIGYLEKYSEQAKTAMQNDNTPIDPQVLLEGHLVRTADGDAWTPLKSAQGDMIVQQAKSRCPADQTIQSCFP